MAWQRDYYARTIEDRRAYGREWRARRDPRRRFAKSANDQARGFGTIERLDWESLPLGPCTYCGRDDEMVSWDHVIPLSRGGPNTAANCVRACRECNAHKYARNPTEWLDPAIVAARRAASEARKKARNREKCRRYYKAHRAEITAKSRAKAADLGHW